MNKINTKSLTEGAMVAAIYGVFVILSRYIFQSVDSLMYYVIALPLMLYSYKNNINSSIITLIVITIVTFLFGNPIYAIMLFFPNYIIGLIFGVLEKRELKFNLFIIFILCIVANLLSILAYTIIMDIGYFDDIYNLIDKFGFDTKMIMEYVKPMIISVIIIDSVMKTLLLYMLFNLIANRIGLIKEINYSLYKIKFSPIISIALIALLILMTLSMLINNLFFKVIFTIMITLITLLSIYLIYQLNYLISIYLSIKNKKGLYFICLLGTFILFPISIIISFILNFILYKK